MRYDEGLWDEAAKDWTLDDSARVWVHVASRRMTSDEAQAVQSHLDEFVAGWQAHGAALKAQAAVVHGWMVLLAVDERSQQATGCSIDASVSALKQIASLHPSMVDLDFFDRMAVLHRSSSETPWKRTSLSTFWAQRKAGLLDDAEQVFDTTVSTLEELKTRGVVLMGASWHAEMW
ncbi:MAG: hypothetical protein ACPH1A_06275 [Flavobacteriales bacterium]